MPQPDEIFMHRCIELALQGAGKVAPNPLVGSVIVYEGHIIGEGYHAQFGDPHAEVNAIRSVAQSDLAYLPSSTLYVNLEPCSHTGKTPPCADLIIEKKIPAVIAGMQDPNPLVAGSGIAKLIQAGCKVKTGVLHEEVMHLNRRFVTWIEKKRPYIILKWAQTMDGFIGKENQSLAISHHYAKTLVHKWRSEEASIMVGTNTALTDNPRLDSRHWNRQNPVRLVPDRYLRLPQTLHLFDGSIPTIVFTAQQKESTINTTYVTIDFEAHFIASFLDKLYERQLQSVLVEGGSRLLQSFIDSGLWDEARIIVAPETAGSGVPAPRMQATPFSRKYVGEDELIIQYHIA